MKQVVESNSVQQIINAARDIIASARKAGNHNAAAKVTDFAFDLLSDIYAAQHPQEQEPAPVRKPRKKIQFVDGAPKKVPYLTQAKSVFCSVCKATTGQNCKAKNGNPMTTSCHSPRIKYAGLEVKRYPRKS